MDAGGNLYGTTTLGGSHEQGTVFKVSGTGAERVLYNFANGTDGGEPFSGLVIDATGNLYGTTSTGGSSGGYGTVFKMSKTGKEKVLYSFRGGTDVEYPGARLVMDAAGNLYGTGGGGSFGYYGTVFKVSNTGKEKVLYSFRGGTDGQAPSDLVLDTAGNLYGTTMFGGSGFGTVFKLSSTGKKTVLYRFTYGRDGAYPQAGVILDSEGNLYGTAFNGGDFNCPQGQGSGCGTVFKLSATGHLTVLYTFPGNSDGAFPAADLVLDRAGNLYGTTEGSLYQGNCRGCGTVFKLDRTGKETVLHNFTGSDGANPTAGVFRDAAGILYGTASEGGDANCTTGYGTGCGTVWMLIP